MLEVIMPFLLFLFVAAIFKHIVSKKGKNLNDGLNNYLEEDRQANYARKKEIPEELFYHIDLARLPIRNYADEEKYQSIRKIQDTVERKAALKMMRLYPAMDNTEIKKEFGYVNLQNFIQYEEHYDGFIRALNQWAEELIALEAFTDAITVLEYALEVKSNYFKTYSLLIDMYALEHNNNKLKSLKERIDEIEIIKEDAILYNKIMDYLDLKTL